MEYQSLVIREAEPSDATTVMKLIRALAAWRDQRDLVITGVAEIERALTPPEQKFAVFLAEVDGRAAGFASYTVAYSIWYGECYIEVDDLWVKESVQGSGVGKALLQAVAEKCLEQNCRARWEIPADNTKAREYYAQMGVEIVDKGVCYWTKDAIRNFLGKRG